MTTQGGGDQLPEGWARTNLGDLRLDRSKSIDPRQTPEELFELYSVTSFPSGKPEVVKGSDIGSAKRTLVPGTVVVCKINPRINRVWVVQEHTGHKKIGSSEWIPFFPIDGLDPHYLAYFCQQDPFRNYLASNVSGVGGSLMRVRPATLAPYPVPVAPAEEQKRIVAALDSYLSRLDDAVAGLERVQRNLKRYRASVLQAAVEGRLVPTEAELARTAGRDYEPASELLKRILAERRRRWEEAELEKLKAKGKPPEDESWKKEYKEPVGPDASELPRLSEGWCWTTLGQAFGVFIGATPRRNVSEYWNGSVAWASSGEVAFSRITATRETITDAGLRNTSTTVHSPGTVLLGMIGEGRTRGQAAILDIPACNSQNSAAIRVSEAGLPPEYVYYYLMGRYEDTRRIGSGGNQPALNKAKVSAIPLPLPPLKEQIRIASRLDGLLSILDHTEETTRSQLGRVQSLRQSILGWAFEGKLVDQDPSDEPAAALLALIRH